MPCLLAYSFTIGEEKIWGHVGEKAAGAWGQSCILPKDHGSMGLTNHRTVWMLNVVCVIQLKPP